MFQMPFLKGTKFWEKGLFFPPVDLQSNVHVWKGLSTQTTHCPFSSVCLCVHCTQLDAFVCLIHKTAKSKIVIMLFISLCCQGLFKQTSTLPPITAASLCQPSRRKHTQHTTITTTDFSPACLCETARPPPPIFPSSSAAVTDGFIPQHINNASSRWMKLYNT